MISVIATVFNEAASLAALLDSLVAQDRPPDEIVIVDAGSTDRTQDIVGDYLARGLPVRLLVEPRASRAAGRNLAIANARGELIASIDAGCVAEPDWLAQLAAPFASPDPPDVVSGYYLPEAASTFQRLVAYATVPTAAEVHADTFLPSSRSVAFTRRAWEKAGGYPEHADCAEDTRFDLELKRAGVRFHFAPEARVHWRMQSGLLGLLRQFFCYARSDGELGHRFPHYPKAYLVWAALLVLAGLCLAGHGHLRELAGGLWLACLAAYDLRYLRRAERRGASRPAALVSGLLDLGIDLVHVLGYTVGRFRRRPAPPRLPTDRPLSIAQITYTYQPIIGGADVYVSQLGDLLREAGHRQVVYQREDERVMGGVPEEGAAAREDGPQSSPTPPHPLPSASRTPFTPSEAEGHTAFPEVRFIPNPLHGRPLEFWTQTLGLFRLWRELAAYDVAICHYPPYLLALHLMSLLTGGPLRVGISHGVFWDDAPGTLPGRLKAWLARLAFRRAHLYIANDTEFLRAMGLRIKPRQRMHGDVAPGVWFIPNGVDTDEFRATTPIAELRAVNPLLVPRNLFRNRGLHLAVAAFDLFRRDHPDTTLVVAGGGGQPDYIAEVRADIARRGLQEWVLFRGSVPHHDLPAVYSSARLTLIPSLCGEGTSLSALESMACGTATICTDVAGLKDLPGPHAAPTPAALADVMRQVYLRRLATGDEQRRRVQADYSLTVWRRSWRRALQSVGVPSDPRTKLQSPPQEE